MLTTLFLPLLLTPQAPTPAAQAIAEIVPIPGLVHYHQLTSLPPCGSLLSTDQANVDLMALSEVRQFEASWVLDLLRTLQPEAFENEKVAAQAIDDSLLVLGDETAVTTLRTQTADLVAMTTRPLQIEVRAWELADGEPPPAVMGPAEYSAFAETRRGLWRATTQATHATAVELSGMRWTRYVRSINAEVAQKEATSAPVTATFGEGGQAVVRVHELVGSDEFVVHGQWCFGGHRGTRVLPTGVPGNADVELPLLETSYGGCSGRVANGGALAVTLRGEPATGGRLVLTIRVQSRLPATARSRGRLAVFPVSALTSRALTQRLQDSELQPLGDDDGGLQFDDTGDRFGCLDAGSLSNTVRSMLGGPDEGIERFEINGGFLVTIGDPAVLSRVEAILTTLQSRLLRTVTVRHTAVSQNGGNAAALTELVAPTLAGRELLLGRYFESNALASSLISIAQEASIHWPGIRRLQAGTLLRARAVPVEDGYHLELTCRSDHGVPPSPRSVQPSGSLMLASVATTRVFHDGIVRSGQSIDLGDGPAAEVEGNVRRCQLAVTVTW